MNTSDCILLAVLLAFSAYFSASETALSTVNKIRLKSYADNGSKKAKIALDIAENYDRTISTILVGNNVVNTASAALMTTVTTGPVRRVGCCDCHRSHHCAGARLR